MADPNVPQISQPGFGTMLDSAAKTGPAKKVEPAVVAQATTTIPIPPKGSPAYYYEKGGKILDSANVPVSVGEIEAHIAHNEAAIKSNAKSMAAWPEMVKLANDTLEKEAAFMRHFVEQQKKKSK